MIRVLLADDQSLVRAGFRMILDGTDDLLVVGEAADGLQALSVAAAVSPDVVLMDVRMPGVDGIEATRRLRAPLPPGAPPHVIILTTFDLDEYVYAGLRAGAAGFLLKDALDTELTQAVRAVAGGHNVAAPTVTRRLVQHFVATDPRPADLVPSDVLTARERDVLRLIAEGMSNLEIAARLTISEGTVKTHVSRILAKLGLRDRIHAVIYAHRTGAT
ncbi:response regulator transcription factor [Dactylosporangium aurantiacum]|uniref:Response regulator transcription factor n=1 Tax=Dactylosporangium aurantiacum TaxID=35754 RepID=A0A9Q9I6V0_9ACTN|nr:response regulator transcription factor [Dactylosporangium aurantiacum]MDG6110474.1 response regulator transcription factor [Dactylosporangium aurantiacum]UWZ50744.1 response regulator transcription factor [Dactylosporangium aurantiacum]